MLDRILTDKDNYESWKWERETELCCEEKNKASDLYLNENIQQATENANLEAETGSKKK